MAIPLPIFDPITAMFMLIAAAVTGWIGWMLRGFYDAARYAPYQVFERGTVIGIVHDITDDTFEHVPLVPFKKGVYLSALPNYPLVVFVPSSVQAKWSKTLRKPILTIIAFRLYGVALDPKILETLGIASLGLEIGSFKCTENIYHCLDRLAQELYRKLGEQSTVISISPDIRLSISYNIPPILRSLLATVGFLGEAAFTQIIETSQISLELARIMQRQMAIQLAGKRFWINILILVGVFALAALALFLVFGGFPGLPLPK